MRTGTLVINAHLTNRAGEQVIEISRSAGLTYPSFDPVSGSLVEVIREDGEFREFLEFSPGYYKAELYESFLQTGTSFMLHVSTPNGNEYESRFDMLRPVPAIDSISGIRFYCDFTYDKEDYEYIRWELTETYEFTNGDLEYYRDGYLEYLFLDPVDYKVKPLPDSSIYRTCYLTNELSSIFSMSLGTLNLGLYVRKPFGFVPNNQKEQKLHHKYSLLVKQYSMGEEAFHYWNELKKTSQEQGSLFDRQPALLKSNIRNVNDENEFVLGFFSMASQVEKRAFAFEPEGLDRSPYEHHCYTKYLVESLYSEGGFYPYEFTPMYLARPWLSRGSPLQVVSKRCVDCREYKNSTNIMPDFW